MEKGFNWMKTDTAVDEGDGEIYTRLTVVVNGVGYCISIREGAAITKVEAMFKDLASKMRELQHEEIRQRLLDKAIKLRW